MKKLALSLEDLAVESFATSEAEGLRGTAHGHMYVTPTEDTAGIPCTGESCRGICSQQICPAQPIAYEPVAAYEPAAAMVPPRPSGATPCFTWQDTVCNCG